MDRETHCSTCISCGQYWGCTEKDRTSRGVLEWLGIIPGVTKTGKTDEIRGTDDSH